MPVQFQCQHCLSHLTVSRKFAGKRGRCPNCRTKILVPEISIGDPFDANDSDTEDLPKTSGPLSDLSDTSEPISRSESEFGNEEDVGGVATRRKRKGRRSRRSSAATAGYSAGHPASSERGVAVPRWIIYAQGVLLGLTATTFFIFGMAVGNTTSSPVVEEQDGLCVVSGAVYYDRGQERRADFGAVVMLLPVDATPRQRPETSGLRPNSFTPVRNNAIEQIRGMGGCVVRADQDGKFQAELQNNRSYWLLVISKNQTANNESIGKQTRAELGTYFLPIESLLESQDFMWHKVRIAGSRQTLQVVTF